MLGSVAGAATGAVALPEVRSISRAVFASPIRLAVNLETARGSASQPKTSYPDISFAVDNFDDPLDCMVRRGYYICDLSPYAPAACAR